jgi:hypothetical protein
MMAATVATTEREAFASFFLLRIQGLDSRFRGNDSIQKHGQQTMPAVSIAPAISPCEKQYVSQRGKSKTILQRIIL